ncbi:glycosyltransferase family 4 protein [Amycolatopsis sp. NBC_00345]|uniref:glycosyltransferase family 4 protein n=1 Tax=Amycolatopsis sp. NBC_00345 TaxID=2975955 RepID=UPI002E255FA7
MTVVLTVVGGYPGAEVTGAQRMAWRSTDALARRGHRVAVLSDTAPPRDVALPHLREPAELAGSEFAGPDFVHVYDVASPRYAALGARIARERSATLLVTPASDPATWPDARLGVAICAQARSLFALTSPEADALRAMGAATGRVRFIPQAPDLVGDGDGDGFRKRHGLTGPMVLFAGRHVPSKGYQLLLQAAPGVWRSRPDTVFVFCGPSSGREVDEFFAAHADDRIRRLGVLADEEKHAAMAACDLVCLPTSADVFPLVFAEAWSCGKPVVSGRFPGVDEVVRHGRDGLVVGLTAHEVGAAVVRLINDDTLRDRIGAHGRTRARDEMTWDRTAALIEQEMA